MSSEFSKKPRPTTKTDVKMETPNHIPLSRKGKIGAISPMDALCLHAADLTEFEQDEILGQPAVYYIGKLAGQAGKVQAVRGTALNHGFDDATGRYAYRQGDHVGYRYQLVESLGKGAFGDCYRAFDHKVGDWVALKILRNEPRFHQQGKTEVAILELLLKHDEDSDHSLVHMIEAFMFRSHLVITFELLGTNLYTELRAGGFKGFDAFLTRQIGNNVLQCLVLLRRLDVVHADLKPENILLRPGALSGTVPPGGLPGSVAKVIDFGSSCFRHGKIHTYIQSRYYRSPEIVLGMGYGPAADMWSLGCILVEIDAGHPLFPGKCESDLLVQIMELLGEPPDKVQKESQRSAEFFDSNGAPLKTTDRKGMLRAPGTRKLTNSLNNKDPAFADFVARCLTWDPQKRMSATEAMEHPWITNIPTDEMVALPNKSARSFI
jgi:serine/threonine protein kinase